MAKSTAANAKKLAAICQCLRQASFTANRTTMRRSLFGKLASSGILSSHSVFILVFCWAKPVPKKSAE